MLLNIYKDHKCINKKYKPNMCDYRKDSNMRSRVIGVMTPSIAFQAEQETKMRFFFYRQQSMISCNLSLLSLFRYDVGDMSTLDSLTDV